MNEPKLTFRSREGEKQYLAMYDKNLSLWHTDYESFYVNTSFGQTHVLASGPIDAQPLVLLHGFGFSSTMWYPNIKQLSANYRVYAIDVIADMNKSVLERPIRAKEDYAIWLNDVFDVLGIDQATVIGHSAGGWQAINFAIQYQHRIRKMVLLAPAASFAPFPMQFTFRLLCSILIPKRPIVIGYFGMWFVAKENVHKVSDSLFEQFYLGLKHFKFSKIMPPSLFTDEELKKITIPVKLLIGDKEIIYNTLNKAVTRAKRLLPQLQFKLITNAGHALSIEQADEVNEEILKFLEEGKSYELSS